MTKKILVRKSVLDALEILREEASGKKGKPHHLAQKLMDNCEAGGDETGKRFWRDVWIHLMLSEYDPGEVQIIDDEGI